MAARYSGEPRRETATDLYETPAVTFRQLLRSMSPEDLDSLTKPIKDGLVDRKSVLQLNAPNAEGRVSVQAGDLLSVLEDINDEDPYDFIDEPLYYDTPDSGAVAAVTYALPTAPKPPSSPAAVEIDAEKRRSRETPLPDRGKLGRVHRARIFVLSHAVLVAVVAALLLVLTISMLTFSVLLMARPSALSVAATAATASAAATTVARASTTPPTRRLYISLRAVFDKVVSDSTFEQIGTDALIDPYNEELVVTFDRRINTGGRRVAVRGVDVNLTRITFQNEFDMTSNSLPRGCRSARACQVFSRFRSASNIYSQPDSYGFGCQCQRDPSGPTMFFEMPAVPMTAKLEFRNSTEACGIWLLRPSDGTTQVFVCGHKLYTYESFVIRYFTSNVAETGGESATASFRLPHLTICEARRCTIRALSLANNTDSLHSVAAIIEVHNTSVIDKLFQTHFCLFKLNLTATTLVESNCQMVEHFDEAATVGVSANRRELVVWRDEDFLWSVAGYSNRQLFNQTLVVRQYSEFGGLLAETERPLDFSDYLSGYERVQVLGRATNPYLVLQRQVNGRVKIRLMQFRIGQDS